MAQDRDLPLSGEIGFDTASGGRLTLKFGTKAMVEVERRLDQSIADLGATLGQGGVRLGHLLVMFHCALLHQDKSLTEDRAAELMDEIGPAKAITLVGQAFDAAWPQEGDQEGGQEGQENPPPPRKAKAKPGPGAAS